MGNHNSTAYEHKTTKLSNFLSVKANQVQHIINKRQCKEHFFIEHAHQKSDNFVDINELDQRRVVFVSLVGLYQTYELCPSVILYSALFVLPLKRKWIYNLSKYLDELNLSDSKETCKFIELLKWKDSQQLVFYMLDEYKTPTGCTNHLIHPFWYNFSAKLEKLYDPITDNNYKQIICDAKFWTNSEQFVAQYNTNASSILEELYFLQKKKFNTLKEIIYQSNNTLCPIKSYVNTSKPFTKVCDDESTWWRCEDISGISDINDSETE